MSHWANPSKIRWNVPPVPSHLSLPVQTSFSVDVVGTWSSNKHPKRRDRLKVSILDAHAIFQVALDRSISFVRASELWLPGGRMVVLVVGTDPIRFDWTGLNPGCGVGTRVPTLSICHSFPFLESSSRIGPIQGKPGFDSFRFLA